MKLNTFKNITLLLLVALTLTGCFFQTEEKNPVEAPTVPAVSIEEETTTPPETESEELPLETKINDEEEPVQETETKEPIAMCDYAAPPEGCEYIEGPEYNKTSGCGMELSCPEERIVEEIESPFSSQPQTEKTETLPSSENAAPVETPFGNSAPSESISIDLLEETQATYTDFSPSTMAGLSGKKFAIFFYADWCPTCRKWDKDLNENLATLPTTTMILKADFDNEELRKSFEVLKQSTVLFFDAKGNQVGNKLDPSLEEVSTFFGA